MLDLCKSLNCGDCNKLLSLFRSLNETQLAAMNEARYEANFTTGETIFKQGGPLTHIATLNKGLVKVHMENESGQNYILKIVKPVSIIGGPGFLVDGRHHFTVTALTESSACFIKVESFKKTLEENNRFCIDVIAYLNRTILNHYQRIGNLAHKHMQGKLAEVLINLSEEIFQSNAFKSHLSRQDLAELTGMTKESVIRVLKEWKEEKIVECKSDYFEILNKESLIKIGRNG
jgi:CRP/FNR family transcriptional regulator